MTSHRDENSHGELRLKDLQSGFLVGAGRFTLNDALFVGHGTAVWKATDNQLEEKVALKFFSSAFATSTMATALRSNVQLARKLSHPHIARTHDLFMVAGELPFVAAEFVEGLNLNAARKIRPDGIFSWAELHPIARQICAALEHAHREGAVHGSLKPNKVILGPQAHARVLGFGSSVVSKSLLERDSPLVPEDLPYVSPQLLNGGPATPADNIYSLAVTVYELLTGRPPFWNGDVRHQILTARTPRLSEHAFENGVLNDIPAQFDDLWFAALSREPSHRPDVRAVCEALDRYPGSHELPTAENDVEPISLIPPSSKKPTLPSQPKTAVEEAQAFEKALPLEFPEQPNASKILQRRGAMVLTGAVFLVGLIAIVWQMAKPAAKATQEIRSPAVQEQVITNQALAEDESRSRFPGLTVVDLGRGPSFTYEYRPQQALALDTNAINHRVKFLRETGDPRANCCFIMTEGQTNHSVGSITYDLRTEPGYVVQDLHVSQSTAHFTHGRVRGEYSLDRGRTFHQFFLTPPYHGQSFGHGGATNLSSLNASNVVIRYTLHRYTGNDYNLQFLRDCNDSSAALRFSASIVKAEMYLAKKNSTQN